METAEQLDYHFELPLTFSTPITVSSSASDSHAMNTMLDKNLRFRNPKQARDDFQQQPIEVDCMILILCPENRVRYFCA